MEADFHPPRWLLFCKVDSAGIVVDERAAILAVVPFDQDFAAVGYADDGAVGRGRGGVGGLPLDAVTDDCILFPEHLTTATRHLAAQCLRTTVNRSGGTMGRCWHGRHRQERQGSDGENNLRHGVLR